MDQLFNFSWINAQLRSLPPALAIGIEEIVRAKGFPRVLTALLASPKAQQHLALAIAAAIALEQSQPAQVDAQGRALAASLQMDFKRLAQ